MPLFKTLPEETLIKISDVLEETFFQQGDYIVSVTGQSMRGQSNRYPLLFRCDKVLAVIPSSSFRKVKFG